MHLSPFITVYRETGTETTIFDTFVQGAGSDRQGGSGLGLAIAKGFADALRIGIAAANHPDGGAAFTLIFSGDSVVTLSQGQER